MCQMIDLPLYKVALSHLLLPAGRDAIGFSPYFIFI